MTLRKILLLLLLVAATAAASAGSFVGAHDLSVAQAEVAGPVRSN